MPSSTYIDLFEVREATGKGLGVFALQDILQGQTITMETPIAFIIKPPTLLMDSDVAEAFNKLSKPQRKDFKTLCQGSRPFRSKLMRIYRTNAYNWPDSIDSTCIAVKISRFNHSCIPNASFERVGDQFRVFALSPIAKGQEITIEYTAGSTYMTGEQRRAVQQYVYGFTCNCKACSSDSEFGRMSDTRRALISRLHYRLLGYKAPDLSPEALGVAGPSSSDPTKVVVPALLDPRDCIKQWSEEDTSHRLLLAKLLEEEGLYGPELASHYDAIGTSLILQGLKDGREMLEAELEQALTWKHKGINLLRCYYGNESSVPN